MDRLETLKILKILIYFSYLHSSMDRLETDRYYVEEPGVIIFTFQYG